MKAVGWPSLPWHEGLGPGFRSEPQVEVWCLGQRSGHRRAVWALDGGLSQGQDHWIME